MSADDETRDLPPPPDEPGGDGDGEETPPPATWAGRRRAAGEQPQGEQPEQPPEPLQEPEQEPPPVEEPEPDPVEEPEPDPVEEPEPDPVEEPEPEEDPVEEPEPDPIAGPVAEGDQLHAGFTEEFNEIDRDLEREFEELEAEELRAGDAEIEADDEEPGAGDEEAAEPAAPGETVEAESVPVLDRAQAEEAALAGLRARAAQHETRQGQAAPALEPESAEEPALVAAAEGGDGGDEGKTPHAKRVWARFLTGSILIVMSVAAATAISMLVFLTEIADGLRDNDLFAKIEDQLPEVDGGEPQTILILGSDRRPTDDTGRSDTTILLRVDPERDSVSMLSIPRDLKVNIPGIGVDKLNAAYSYGGPKLTYRVVRNLVGIDIHHLVNINFTGFADAVNAIGCVYIDVDRRYFIPPESGVAEINIESGYQRLCGLKALQYVRFRHDDTDLVRSARQQDFLREARQKLSPEQIIRDTDYRNELVDIFTDYTTSDISSATELLNLIKTFIGAAGATVNEVHFPAELGGPGSLYVTAERDEIQTAVEQFLGTGGTPGPPPEGTSRREQEKPEGGGDKPNKPDGDKPDPEPSGPVMDDVSETGQAVAKQLEAAKRKDGDPMVDFPIEYPTRMLPGSTLQTADQASRAFPIDGPADDVYHGYKIVLDFFGAGGFYEYYGVSGTDWLDAPILENPSETRTIDGRDYLLFYDGDRLRLVGWKTKKAIYWVNNTLAQTLDEDVMLSIATSMRELGK